MPKYSEKEFLTSLKSSPIPSLFLFYGPDEYSKEICQNKLLKLISNGDTPILFDGQALDIKALYEECTSVSFFGDQKVVIVRNPNIDSFSSEASDNFYSVLEDKPDSTYLILIFKAIETLRPSAKLSKLLKEVEKNGAVIDCAEKTQKDAVSMILSTVKKNGCSIEKELCENLAERCLNDMLLIESNLFKLCAYASEKTGGVITIDAIENLTARLLDNKAYEITKHIINRKPELALKTIYELFLQQVDAIAINSALASAFLDIYRVKTMQQYNHPFSELNSSFDYKGKDYKIRGASYDAAKCSLDFIKNAVLLLSKSDILLKSTKDDKKTVIEKTVIEIIYGETKKQQ